MSTPPLTPSEETGRRLEEERRLYARLEELRREWQEETARHTAQGYLPEVDISPLRRGLHARDLRTSLTSPQSTVIPAWLTPLLQGITILFVMGAVFWVGQTTGTINTKVDNLQKSVDSLNSWQDTASISLGSVDTKVTLLNSKIDDLSKDKR